MNTFDFGHLKMKQSLLPVGTLQGEMLNFFQFLGNKDELEIELKKGLNKKIKYHITDQKIKELPNIDSNKQIHVYENYNQFLWNFCYANLNILDCIFLKPIENDRAIELGDFDINSSNRIIQEAYLVFNAGMKLFKEFDRPLYFDLPNPERGHNEMLGIIEKVNSIYLSGVACLLYHEYAHHYYEHLDYYPPSAESKEEEFDADNYSYSVISKHFSSGIGRTLKIGIVSFFSSFFLLNKTLYGGSRHPDNDIRLKNIIEKMNLADNDFIWLIPSISFKLWKDYYRLPIAFPTSIVTYKDYYYSIVEKVNLYKENLDASH